MPYDVNLRIDTRMLVQQNMLSARSIDASFGLADLQELLEALRLLNPKLRASYFTRTAAKDERRRWKMEVGKDGKRAFQ